MKTYRYSEIKMFKLVNFAQKKAYLVEDEKFQKAIREKVSDKYRLNLRTGNKYYKFLDDKDLPVLKKFEHRICFNLKQKPTYLFLTTFQKQKFCLYFDVEMKEIYSVRHRFDEDLFDDTLLEGELIKVSQQHYIYLVSDLLILHEKINTEHLDKKLTTLHKIVEIKHRPDPGFDPCQLLVKDFVEYKYMESLMNNHYLTVPYRQYISGLIFRPVVKSNRNIITVLDKNNFHKINIPETSPSIVSDKNIQEADMSSFLNIEVPEFGGGFSLQNLLQKFQEKDEVTCQLEDKLSPASQNENVVEKTQEKRKKLKIDYKKHTVVNFEIRNTEMPDVYELWLLNEDEKLYKYGIACIPTRDSSELIKSWFSDGSGQVIVACRYIKNFSKWQPLKRLSEETNPDKITKIAKV